MEEKYSEEFADLVMELLKNEVLKTELGRVNKLAQIAVDQWKIENNDNTHIQERVYFNIEDDGESTVIINLIGHGFDMKNKGTLEDYVKKQVESKWGWECFAEYEEW